MNALIKLLFAVVATVVVVAVFYRLRLALAGLRVTSWFRHPWKNERVGGVALSRHQFGLAFDVTPVNSAVGEKLRAMGFKLVLNETDHYHVEVI